MEKITKIGAEELESSLKEDDKHGLDRLFKQHGIQNLKKEFDQDQDRNCELMHMLNTMSGSVIKNRKNDI